jgi:hypothetical protein
LEHWQNLHAAKPKAALSLAQRREHFWIGTHPLTFDCSGVAPLNAANHILHGFRRISAILIVLVLTSLCCAY